MKRFSLILSLFALLTLTLGVRKGFSQNRTDHAMIGVGAMVRNGLDATLSYEHETKYHNSWEYFANGYLQWDDCENCGHICDESFWNNYKSISGGIAYKPCIIRSRNNHGNLRIGCSVGYDTDGNIISGIHLGYEHDYSLRSGVQLYWQLKCDGVFEARDFLRVGATIGIKLPTSNN